jgi:hypothetical protein
MVIKKGLKQESASVTFSRSVILFSEAANERTEKANSKRNKTESSPQDTAHKTIK